MALQHYQPNSVLQQFNNEINRLFSRSFDDYPALANSGWVPAVDVQETEDAYRIEADVPGIKADDIEVTLEKGVLTLRGERKAEHDAEQQGTRHVERSYGAFVRRFSLPDTADADNIDAEVNNGVLRLTIKKKAESKPRRIEVKVNS
jgi:HSP20 family protein